MPKRYGTPARNARPADPESHLPRSTARVRVLLRLQQISKDALQVPQGSLYPALYRLEHQGLVTFEWGESDNKRQAKYYSLTSAGPKAAARGDRLLATPLRRDWARARRRAGRRLGEHVRPRDSRIAFRDKDVKVFASLKSFTRASILRSRMEREMDAEMRFHLESRAADLERQGLSRAEAERVAHAEFGSVVKWKEAGRDARGLRLVDDLRADLRYAVRTMRRTPAFTAAAVVSIALGIGANTAIFGLMDLLLLRPVPVRNPHELVHVSTAGERSDGGSGSSNYPWFRDVASRTDLFSDAMLVRHDLYKVGIRGRVEPLTGQRVTTNYYDLLGVSPVLGRMFVPGDRPESGASPVAVISYRLWQTKLCRRSERARRIDHSRSAALHHHRCGARRVPGHSRRLDDGRDDAARFVRIHRSIQLVHDAAHCARETGRGRSAGASTDRADASEVHVNWCGGAVPPSVSRACRRRLRRQGNHRFACCVLQPAAPADGGRRPAPADRVRESGGLAHRAQRRAAARDCHACRAWRQLVTHHAATADRERGAGTGRSDPGSAAGDQEQQSASGVPAARFWTGHARGGG